MSPSTARYIDCVTDTLILITLLVKLGVAAAVASALARSRTFQRLLFAEHRRHRQTAAMLAFFCGASDPGVWVRIAVPIFWPPDISFETVILLGLLVGPGWAMLGGIALSAPAVYHHEFLALPFNAALVWPRACWPLCGDRRDLVVHAVHRLEPLPLGAAQSSPAAHRPPDSHAVSDCRA